MNFKYSDRVRVINGFFQGMTGEVIDISVEVLVFTKTINIYKYQVKLNNNYVEKDEYIVRWINERDLEKIERIN